MNDSTFVILGATGGIGSAVSRQLAGKGARLGLAARDRGRLDSLASELGGAVVELGGDDSAVFGQEQTQVVLADGAVLAGRGEIPGGGALQVLIHAVAVLVHHRQVDLGVDVAALGERSPELHRPGEITPVIGVPTTLEAAVRCRRCHLYRQPQQQRHARQQ